MKYRQIKTNFWDDNYILDLSQAEKLFFLYLFTNPKVNICGIYELPDRTICYTLGATLDEITKTKAKFEKDNKYYFYKGWVFIANFSDHNIYSSAKGVISSFVQDFNNIPDEVKIHFLDTLKLNYQIPINNWESVLVMSNVNVKDKVKDKRVWGRVCHRVSLKLNEDIDPSSIPL